MSHYSPIVAALVTMILTAVFLSSKFGQKIQDVPNERSLHEIPVPRVGGVALMAGVLSGWAIEINDLAWWLVLPVLLLFIISLIDDIYSLPVTQRLWVHLLAATLLIFGSNLVGQQGILVALLAFIFVVWMTNLYNFMDGSDGLAGGMAFFGFTFYGVAGLMNQHVAFAMLNFSVGAAALGFLFNNFHPAKVFMGDAGSIPLGFLAAAMGLWGWQLGFWSVWFPLIVFSPFIVDASVTLLKRAVRGVKVTEAHREHYFQRAIQLGLGHRNVALIEYVFMIAAGVSALSALHEHFPVKLLFSLAIVYLLLMLFMEVCWAKFKRTTHD